MLICPCVCFLTFFPSDFSCACCTHSFDLQTLSSSSSNALPCSTFEVLAQRAEMQQFSPLEISTPCGCKCHLWVQCWGQPSVQGDFQRAAGWAMSLPLYAKSFPH